MRFFIKYGLSCATALLILHLSISTPGQEVEMLFWFEGQDKVVHFLMYAFFSFVLSRDFYKQKVAFSSLKMYLAAVAIPILYGGLIEILQENFFPPRSGDWWDFLADIAGVTAGYCLARWVVPQLVNRM